MKSLGFSLDQIAKQVGLSVVQVKEILQKNAPSNKKDKRYSRVGAHQQKNNRPPLNRGEEKPVRCSLSQSCTCLSAKAGLCSRGVSVKLKSFFYKALIGVENFVSI